MNLGRVIGNYYSKLSITCDSPIGKVTCSESYVPVTHLEEVVEKTLAGLSEDHNTQNCEFKAVQQPYGEDRISTITFEQNPYTSANSKKEVLKPSNPRTRANDNPITSTIATIGIVICGGVFAHQSIQTIANLKKKKPKQAVKHGMVAIFSVVLFLLFARTLLRI